MATLRRKPLNSIILIFAYIADKKISISFHFGQSQKTEK